MKRLTIFLTIFTTLTMGLIAFFGVKTNALAKILPNDGVKEYDMTGIRISHTFEDEDFVTSDIDLFGSFTNNFYNDNYSFVSNQYILALEIVIEADDMPNDITTYFSLYINGLEIINSEGDFIVSSVDDGVWSLLLTETLSSPNFSKEIVLIKDSAYSFFIHLDDMSWFSYNIVNSYLNIDILTDTSPLYKDWFDYGFNFGKGEGLDEGFGKGYDIGKREGFNEGKEKGLLEGAQSATDYSFIGLLNQVFIGLGSFLAINLLPGISIGAIIAVPIVFGIIAFIIGKRGGKDD